MFWRTLQVCWCSTFVYSWQSNKDGQDDFPVGSTGARCRTDYLHASQAMIACVALHAFMNKSTLCTCQGSSTWLSTATYCGSLAIPLASAPPRCSLEGLSTQTSPA